MPESHGGYRRPSEPAVISGPGALSQRTDGGVADGQAIRRLPSAKYGESKEFESIQAGAPVAQARPVDASGVVPMDAGTRYPDRPVTQGALFEEPDNGATNEDDLLQLGSWMPALVWKASKPGSTNAFRQLVRQLRNLQ